MIKSEQPKTGSAIELAILKALADQSEEIKERLIKSAVAEFEKEVRQAVGRVAINLAEYYSIETVGGHLVIQVKIETERK